MIANARIRFVVKGHNPLFTVAAFSSYSLAIRFSAPIVSVYLGLIQLVFYYLWKRDLFLKEWIRFLPSFLVGIILLIIVRGGRNLFTPQIWIATTLPYAMFFASIISCICLCQTLFNRTRWTVPLLSAGLNRQLVYLIVSPFWLINFIRKNARIGYKILRIRFPENLTIFQRFRLLRHLSVSSISSSLLATTVGAKALHSRGFFDDTKEKDRFQIIISFSDIAFLMTSLIVFGYQLYA